LPASSNSRSPIPGWAASSAFSTSPTVPPSALSIFDFGEGDTVYYRVTTSDGRLLAGYVELAPPPAGSDTQPRYYDSRFHDEAVRLAAVRQDIPTPGRTMWATVVVADGPIEAPPTVTDGWSGILVHPDYAAPTVARLRVGAIVLYNSAVFPEPHGVSLGIPATTLAVEAGNAIPTFAAALEGAQRFAGGEGRGGAGAGV